MKPILRMAPWALLLCALPAIASAAPEKRGVQDEAQTRAMLEHGLRLATGELWIGAKSYTPEVPAAMRAAWEAFTAALGPDWTAYFDRETEVPGRIWGGGILVPGVMKSPAIAELHARSILRAHRALLAPGAGEGDLVLISNVSDGEMRTVAFAQKHAGMDVIGGQVSLRYKGDRLFVIGSEAYPNVEVERVSRTAEAREAEARAAAWVSSDFGDTVHVEGAVSEPRVLAIRRGSGLEYHAVLEVRVKSERPVGLWSVYVDATSALPIARKQRLMFSDGTVQFNAPERYPSGARQNYPASHATVSIAGAAVNADVAGLVSFAQAAPVQVHVRASGTQTDVINQAGTATAATFMLQPGGAVIWNASHSELNDAQLVSYITTEQIKAYAKKIAPNDPWMTTQWQVNVNINMTCNAYSDGTTTNFFRAAPGQCENTGRLPDVVGHESGHGIHANAIIPGAGNFDTPLSEGVSDYLSATWHDDPQMGRGFFYDSHALRDLDPPNQEARWPQDIDPDPHQTGLIIGGALWDLRKALVQKMGHDQGVAHTDKLWYAILQRAADIPSTYVEVLAADDNDGNLMNGTPNMCEINAAFALHGLADTNKAGPGIGSPVTDQLVIRLPVHPNMQCPGARASGANVSWRLRDNPMTSGTVDMTFDAQGSELVAMLPAPEMKNQVIEYNIQVALTDHTSLNYPDNRADPWYQMYYGASIPLYCTDFERDPATEMWAHTLESGPRRAGSDDWQWGLPAGKPGSYDPDACSSGTHCIGNDLGILPMWDGKYTHDIKNMMASAPIDVMGHTKIHLQFKRWLSVEDGVYDHARIYGNDTVLWSNYATDMNRGDWHHIDKEWRFQDVDLSGAVADGKVAVKFELESDPALEFGGWNVDDLCVVAIPECGNGIVEPGEDCDLGAMMNDGMKCTAMCTLPAPPMMPPMMMPSMPPDMGMQPMPSPPMAMMPSGMTPGMLKTIHAGACGCTSARRSDSADGTSLFFAAVLVALVIGRRGRRPSPKRCA